MITIKTFYCTNVGKFPTWVGAQLPGPYMHAKTRTAVSHHSRRHEAESAKGRAEHGTAVSVVLAATHRFMFCVVRSFSIRRPQRQQQAEIGLAGRKVSRRSWAIEFKGSMRRKGNIGTLLGTYPPS